MRIVDNIKSGGAAGECRKSGGDLLAIWRCIGCSSDG